MSETILQKPHAVRCAITECPRDGQQGLPFVISPENRAAYINKLMQVGFDIIDFGSFVSPKAVPQMAASSKVLNMIDTSNSPTKLLAIIGNTRGALEAANEEKLEILGFPYSISDTFLHKNINSGIEVVFKQTIDIKKICDAADKKLRVYMSMAFGNPYGDTWSEQILLDEVKKLVENGIQIITLSDTIGLGTPEMITSIFEKMTLQFSNIEIGIHLHTKPQDAYAKLEAAWNAGCRNFDGVLNGFGGCPMTGYELLGNLNTLEILRFFESKNITTSIDNRKAKEIALHYSSFAALA